MLVQGYDLGVARHGGFAAYARVPADWVVALPDALSCRNAAIIGLAGFTALMSLRRLVQHGTGRDDGPILVTGASGGVGSAAVALLVQRGLRGRRLLGQDDRARLPEEPRGVPRGRAPDSPRTTDAPWGPSSGRASSTAVGGTALAEALRTVRYGGAVAASGLTGGNDLATTVYPFIVRGVSLLGIDTVATPIEERRNLWADMPGAFPLRYCEDMVNEEIGLGGLTRPSTGCSTPRCGAGSWSARVADPSGRGVDGRDPDRPVAAGPNGQRKAPVTPSWRRAWSRWPARTCGQVVSEPTGTSEYW